MFNKMNKRERERRFKELSAHTTRGLMELILDAEDAIDKRDAKITSLETALNRERASRPSDDDEDSG